jgi:hypothetical protein
MLRILFLVAAFQSAIALKFRHRSQQGPDGKDIKVFCFAWITNRPKELAILPDMKEQLSGCDGHAMFGHKGTNHPDVIEVEDALVHPIGRDMVHLIPTWTHLLKKVKNLDEYDWLLNVEWDHLVRPSKVRLNIARDLGVLQRGTEAEQASIEQPMMLMWGNSFVFNRKLTQEMRKQWPYLGKTMVTTGEENGCPEWYVPKESEKGKCSQDLAYPQMLERMEPHVAGYGRPGCSQFAKNDLGEEFHLACYNMPTGGEKRTTEFNPTVTTQFEVIKAAQKGEKYANFDLKDVPIFHKVYDKAVHELGRKLLGESSA